jgi:hypothetical protein
MGGGNTRKCGMSNLLFRRYDIHFCDCKDGIELIMEDGANNNVFGIKN